MAVSTAPIAATQWTDSGLDRRSYLRCYDRALTRMAVALNAGRPTAGVPRSLLKKSDDALAAVFAGGHRMSRAVRLHEIRGDQREDLEERAEDHFYGRFSFSEMRDPVGAVKVTHEATDTFIDWSLLRLRRPEASESLLRSSEFSSEKAFAMHCAANYLLKNFWHNFVHERLQLITHDNYRVFRGESRYASDFEADNIANLLLLHSYGISVTARGSVSATARDQMLTTFERNRCNLVFAERAGHRLNDRTGTPADEAWREFEWRERRALTNQLSQQLALEGSAAAHLSVIFCGNLEQGRAKVPFRRPPVVVAVNGCYIDTPFAPYLPGDQFLTEVKGKALEGVRLARVKSFRTKRRQEIVAWVVGKYKSLLERDQRRRDAAEAALRATFARGGLSGLGS